MFACAGECELRCGEVGGEAVDGVHGCVWLCNIDQERSDILARFLLDELLVMRGLADNEDDETAALEVQRERAHDRFVD